MVRLTHMVMVVMVIHHTQAGVVDMMMMTSTHLKCAVHVLLV
jgi:hypothetical protein